MKFSLDSKQTGFCQKYAVHVCLEDDPADRPSSTDLYREVEKCMKEIDSPLVAHWFEKSKLELLEANRKLAIRVSDLKKEVIKKNVNYIY